MQNILITIAAQLESSAKRLRMIAMNAKSDNQEKAMEAATELRSTFSQIRWELIIKYSR